MYVCTGVYVLYISILYIFIAIGYGLGYIYLSCTLHFVVEIRQFVGQIKAVLSHLSRLPNILLNVIYT